MKFDRFDTKTTHSFNQIAFGLNFTTKTKLQRVEKIALKPKKPIVDN